MFRARFDSSLCRGTPLKINGAQYPSWQPRVVHYGDWQKVLWRSPDGRSPDGRSQYPPPDNLLGGGRCVPIMGPMPPADIHYQDIRDEGPLFNLKKLELDADPEKAKTQWRQLCVVLERKQDIVNGLWKKNGDLKARCSKLEAEAKDIRGLLESSKERQKELAVKAKLLETRCANTETEKERIRRTLVELQAVNAWLDKRYKSAEVEEWCAKDRLEKARRARMFLEAKFVKIAAEVKSARRAVGTLRRLMKL